MSHEMSDGRPCGRPDGHNGQHMSQEFVAKRREYIRDYRQTRTRAQRRAASAKKHDARVCREFGLQPGEYATLKAAQGGKCAICQRATGRTKRLSVDHDHKNRHVRGLLCSRDNYMLGHIRDDPAALQRAIDYLLNPPALGALGRIPVVPEDSPAQIGWGGSRDVGWNRRQKKTSDDDS